MPRSYRPTHAKRTPLYRARTLVLALALAALAALAAPALADPDFGPGNSSKGPNDGGAKCHPPGQTVEEPGCK